MWRGGKPLALLVAAMTTLGPRTAIAHEIPPSVLVQLFVRTDSDAVSVRARLPLEALRDIDFPVRGQGFVDAGKAGPYMSQAAITWLLHSIRITEGPTELAGQLGRTRLSMPSDRAFSSYASASAHMDSTLDPKLDVPWKQATLDVELTYPRRGGGAIAIDPQLARLGIRTTTVLTFVTADGRERSLEYLGDPGLVPANPGWLQLFGRYSRLGFEHILDGIDHLLFVFCLVIPMRRIKPLLGVVTAFTVAHSITLACSALGLAPDGLWFPPLVEVLIAMSILYMALENIVGAKTERRWIIAFGFGLVHGFGFSFALKESLQFAGAHIPGALFAFNLGVEAGQILVLAIAVPVLAYLFRRVVAERMGTIILSAFVAHTAWHWLTDRWGVFRKYPVSSDALLGIARYALAGLVLVLAASLVVRAVAVLRPRPSSEPVTP
jgi:hypothetical protein